MSNTHRHTRDFVLHFEPVKGPESTNLTGWVEHVATGRAVRFHGADELLAFVTGLLAIEESLES